METGSVILKPSYSRPPNWQGCDLTEALADFSCSRCGSSIEVRFGRFLRRERSIDKQEEAALEALFEIPIVGKSHDGGWPRFDLIACGECDATFAVYVGVNETSNSVYAFTLQGIVEAQT